MLVLIWASEAKGRGFDPRQPHQTNQDLRFLPLASALLGRKAS